MVGGDGTKPTTTTTTKMTTSTSGGVSAAAANLEHSIEELRKEAEKLKIRLKEVREQYGGLTT